MRSPKSVDRIPTIRQGQRIRASYLNTIARQINDVAIHAPTSIDEGRVPGESPQRPPQWPEFMDIVEFERSEIEVRVENPEDSEQFVDVARTTVTLGYDLVTGTVIRQRFIT